MIPSLRKLLFVVPVFAAVGVMMACSPYIGPICAPPATSCAASYSTVIPSSQPAQCPTVSSPGQPSSVPCNPPTVADTRLPPPTPDAGVFYYEPVTNPQGQTYYVQRRAPVGTPSGLSGTSLSVADGKIQVQTMDGSRMACEKLTILVGGLDPAEVSVADNLIKITSGKDIKEGSFLQASARKVTRTATDGAQLVLEGDAKLLYMRKGKKIEVATDLLSVNLSTGQVISELDAPKPTAPVGPPKTTTGSTSEVVPSTKTESPRPTSPMTR